MEALGIAFNNIIIGALALPWALFAADLFFLKNPEDENRVRVAWAFVTKNVDPRVAGVVLFAVTYLVGSAISRTAEDFFNDAELIGPWLTEDYIRTAEYCDQDKKIRDTFGEITSRDFDKCPHKDDTEKPKWGTCKYWLGRSCDIYPQELVRETQLVFRTQEGALLLNGEDKTKRLHELHDHIVVLRGAAFNGFLALVLCLFGWCARQKTAVRWLLTLAPLLILVLGLYWLHDHFQRTGINEAPFMELTAILLGVAGLGILYKGENRRWFGLELCLTLLLFVGVAYLGWWRSEVLYSRQVIYSFHAQRVLIR